MSSESQIQSIGVPPDYVEYFVAQGWRLRSQRYRDEYWVCRFVDLEEYSKRDITLISSNLETHWSTGQTPKDAAEAFIQTWNEKFQQE